MQLFHKATILWARVRYLLAVEGVGAVGQDPVHALPAREGDEAKAAGPPGCGVLGHTKLIFREKLCESERERLCIYVYIHI